MVVKASPHTSYSIYEIIKEKAKELGFVGIGFLRPKRPIFFERFLDWLEKGKNAEMEWMKRYVDIREDPRKILNGCKTIISLAYPYSPNIPSSPDGIIAARYTEPLKEDYHIRLKRLCRRLSEETILKVFPDAKIRICVDSAPVLERSIAYMAGVGFIGKNNMLIVPGYGSYVFLSEIFTTADFSFPEPKIMEDHCNNCERCIDSCPTGALKKPYCFDARRCLSYISIEYKGEIKEEFAKRMFPFFFGCDRCQQVCPFNERGERFVCLPSVNEFLNMEKDEFEKRFGRTALRRVGLERIKRNLRAIM